MTKKLLNIWYKKVLNKNLHNDIHDKILNIINKESML